MLLVAIGLSKSTTQLAKLMLSSFLLAFIVCALDDEVKTFADAFNLQFVFISLIYSFPIAGLIQIVHRLKFEKSIFEIILFACLSLILTLLLASFNSEFSQPLVLAFFPVGLLLMFTSVNLLTFGVKKGTE